MRAQECCSSEIQSAEFLEANWFFREGYVRWPTDTYRQAT